MPTYEYECRSCGHSFEAFQSMADDPIRACPKCGEEVRRVINGGAGIIFKGSGFYSTDSKKASSKSLSSTKSESTGSEAGTTGESSPAPKTGDQNAATSPKSSKKESA